MCVELLPPRPRNHPHLSDSPHSPGPFPGSRLIYTMGRKPPKTPLLTHCSGMELRGPTSKSLGVDRPGLPQSSRAGQRVSQGGLGQEPPRPAPGIARPRLTADALRSTPLHATRSLARRDIPETRGFRGLQSLYLLAVGANWYPIDAPPGQVSAKWFWREFPSTRKHPQLALKLSRGTGTTGFRQGKTKSRGLSLFQSWPAISSCAQPQEANPS